MRIEGAAVAGIGMVRFGNHRGPQHGASWPATPGSLALHDAGITLADVDEAFVGYIQPASMLGIKAMKELGLTGLPVTHIENASATGLVAFREAAWAVASGRAEVAMAHRLRQDDRHDARRRPAAAPAATSSTPTILPAAVLRAVGAAAHARPRHHARALRRRSRRRTGTTAPLNPLSNRQPDHAVTVDEVLASRMIAEPLTAMMACPADDGAACVIVAVDGVGAARTSPTAAWCGRSPRRCRASPTRPATPSSVRWSGPATMTSRDRRAWPTRTPGSAPTTSHLALCHDAFANEELEYYELLGFCAEGEGEQLLEAGRHRARRAHPVQHRRRPHRPRPPRRARPAWPWSTRSSRSCGARPAARQVEGARRGLAHLVGGGSVCTVNLFEAD